MLFLLKIFIGIQIFQDYTFPLYLRKDIPKFGMHKKDCFMSCRIREMVCSFMFSWPDDLPQSVSEAFSDSLMITLPEGLLELVHYLGLL